MLYFRKKYFYLGLLAFISSWLADGLYRSWIIHNDFNDYGLSGFLPSITGTVTAIFLYLGLFQNNNEQLFHSAVGLWIGCLIYEILQPTLGTGVFDIADLIAIFVTGIISCLFVYNR